jgi:transcriptional regulator with XRE-family HTH domain
MTSEQDGDRQGSSGAGKESVDALIGRRVKNRREALGLNLRAFGAAMHLSVDEILEIESGKRRAGATLLSAFGFALDVPISYFFSGYESDGKTEAAQNKNSKRRET